MSLVSKIKRLGRSPSPTPGFEAKSQHQYEDSHGAPDNRLKILCLHGYHGSAAVMRAQLGSLTKALSPYAELVTIDAPSLGYGDFGWWHATANSLTGDTTYQGWERTLEGLNRVFEEQGPFDGILGFSQGAILAGTLCGLKTAWGSGAIPSAQNIAFDFAIMVGGFVPRDKKLDQFFHKQDLFDIPSLHVYGTSDAVVPANISRKLSLRFKDPQIITHSGGHIIEHSGDVLPIWVSFIREQLARKTHGRSPAYDHHSNHHSNSISHHSPPLSHHSPPLSQHSLSVPHHSPPTSHYSASAAHGHSHSDIDPHSGAHGSHEAHGHSMTRTVSDNVRHYTLHDDPQENHFSTHDHSAHDSGHDHSAHTAWAHSKPRTLGAHDQDAHAHAHGHADHHTAHGHVDHAKHTESSFDERHSASSHAQHDHHTPAPVHHHSPTPAHHQAHDTTAAHHQHASPLYATSLTTTPHSSISHHPVVKARTSHRNPINVPLWSKGPGQMKVFFPPNQSDSPVPAFVVFRGGAYSFSMGSGGGAAQWSTTQGFVGIEVDYGTRATSRFFPDNIADGARAVRLVRRYAKDWGINPNRVVCMGFSAGGHMAATLATQSTIYESPDDDLVSRYSARPDAVVLGYGVLSFVEGYYPGSYLSTVGNFFGTEKVSEERRKQLSAELNVRPDAPPAFAWTVEDDKLVPPSQTQLYADACRNAGVPVELRMYPTGGHGCGLALDSRGPVANWTNEMLRWLDTLW